MWVISFCSHLQGRYYLTDLETSFFGEGKKYEHYSATFWKGTWQIIVYFKMMHTRNIQPWIIQIPGVAAVFWATFTIRQLAKSLMSSRALCSTQGSSQKPKTYFCLLLVPIVLFHRAASNRQAFCNTWSSPRRVIMALPLFLLSLAIILKRATEVTSSHTAPDSTGGCWRTSSLSAGWSDQSHHYASLPGPLLSASNKFARSMCCLPTTSLFEPSCLTLSHTDGKIAKLWEKAQEVCREDTSKIRSLQMEVGLLRQMSVALGGFKGRKNYQHGKTKKAQSKKEK